VQKKTFFLLFCFCLCAKLAPAQVFWPLSPWVQNALSPSFAFPLADTSPQQAVGTAPVQELLRCLDSIIQIRYIDTTKIAKLSSFLQDSNTLLRYAQLWPSELAWQLEQDLQRHSGDRHFMCLHYLPADDPPASRKRRNTQSFYNFRAVQLLPQGLGYMALDEFSSKDQYPEAQHLHTALPRLFRWFEPAHTLVIDLRQNLGGKMQAAADLLVWFLPPRRYEMVSKMAYRDKQSPHQTLEQWIMLRGHPKSKINRTRQIYVLTSRYTFSAAEIFTQILRSQYGSNLKIVGEKTAGGVHGFEQIHEHNNYYFTVPDVLFMDQDGHSIEGLGLEPDIAVPAAQALDTVISLLAQQAKPQVKPRNFILPNPSAPPSWGLMPGPQDLPLGHYGRLHLRDSLGRVYLQRQGEINPQWLERSIWPSLFRLEQGNWLFWQASPQACLCLIHAQTGQKECYRKEE
jgi:hypothetical protein